MSIVITIGNNVKRTTDELSAAIKDLIDNQEPILLAIASSVLAEMSHRIHTRGLRADGSKLGTYSNSYMRTRERHNRTDSKEVVASLTRQMENDFSVVATAGKVGLGFKNKENFKKAGYIEEMYPGTYKTSAEEDQLIIETVQVFIDDIFG